MLISGSIDSSSKKITIDSLHKCNAWETQTKSTENLDIIAMGKSLNSKLIDKLNLYWGTKDESVLCDINGPFSCVYIDKNKITIVVDRFNRIPLYYYSKGGNYAISDDINNIIEFSDGEMSRDSIIEFLTFGYVLGENTLFSKIKTTKSGSIIELENNKYNIRYYWQYQPMSEYNNSGDPDTLHDIWKNCVHDRIDLVDGDLMILLSGGLDSRAILATAMNYVDKDRITVATFGQPRSDDYTLGKAIVNEYDLDFISMGMEFPCVHDLEANARDSDGMIDVFPRFPVNQMNKLVNNNEYILSGYIGDFITGGHYNEGKYQDSDHLYRDYFEDEANEYVANYLPITDEYGNFRSRVSNVKFPSHDGSYQELFAKEHIDKWSLYTVFRHRSKTKYLCPFLDNRFVNYYEGVSKAGMRNQTLFRDMLYNNYPEIFEIPSTSTYRTPIYSSRYRQFVHKIPHFLRRQGNRLFKKVIDRKPFFVSSTNYIDYDRQIHNNTVFRECISNISSEYGSNIERVDKDFEKAHFSLLRHVISINVIKGLAKND